MTVFLWVLVALGVWYVAGREQDAKMKALLAKADTARVAFDTARTVVIQTQYKTKAASKREREAQMVLTARLALLEDSIATYRAVAADGTSTADTLREALVRATDQLDTLKGMAIAYSVSVDSLKAAYAEERRAAIVALTKADAVIRMQDSVIYRLQRPLPRTQTVKVFAAGIGIGIAIAVLR
jgi:hypothetical protein